MPVPKFSDKYTQTDFLTCILENCRSGYPDGPPPPPIGQPTAMPGQPMAAAPVFVAPAMNPCNMSVAPVQMICPSCGAQIVTRIVHENGTLVWILFVILLMYLDRSSQISPICYILIYRISFSAHVPFLASSSAWPVCHSASTT